MRSFLGLFSFRTLFLVTSGMRWQKRPGPSRTVKETGLLNGEKRHGSPGFSHPYSKQGSKAQIYTIIFLLVFAILALFMLYIPRPRRADSRFLLREDIFPNYVSDAISDGGEKYSRSLKNNLGPLDRDFSRASDDGQLKGENNERKIQAGVQESAENSSKNGWLENFGFWLREESKTDNDVRTPPESRKSSVKQTRKRSATHLEPEVDLPITGRFGSNGTDSCDPKFALIRLYMHELGGEYNFGILNYEYMFRQPQNVSDIPRYRGGMYQQHSPEYWLTVDLLTSRMEDRTWPCTAVRVFDPADADLIWVPFFASMAYNRYTNEINRAGNRTGEVDHNQVLQFKLVDYLHQSKLWRKTKGRDHVIVVHHPNSMHLVREQLGTAILVLADFGRYSPQLANVEKDVIAPYKHVIPTFTDDQNGFQERPTLLFFQGMIVRKDGGIIRQQLYDILREEEGVHFTTGNTQRDGIRSATQGMRSSRFCLHLAGDTPSSNRLFDAIVSHCVPVIISDDIELPFEDFINYSEFCIFIRANDSLIPGHVISLLRGTDEVEWTAMWKRLKEVDLHYEYAYPIQPYDATSMIWRALEKKMSTVNFILHRRQRYLRSINALVQWRESQKLSMEGSDTSTAEQVTDMRRRHPEWPPGKVEEQLVLNQEDGEVALRHLVISAEREVPGRHSKSKTVSELGQTKGELVAGSTQDGKENRYR